MDQQHLLAYVQQLTNARAALEFQVIQLTAKLQDLEKSAENAKPEEAQLTQALDGK